MKYKIKIITGFRKDQEYSISADEAHKAYYLFAHPDERGIFSDGLALRGTDIKGIEPDYNGTMGWNPTHTLTSDDWNDIHKQGVMSELRDTLCLAKEIAQHHPAEIGKPLSTLKYLAPKASEQGSALAAQMRLARS